MMVFSLFANGGSDKPAASSSEPVEFIINNGAEPESLDPHKIEGVSGNTEFYMSLFEGLVTYDPKTGRGRNLVWPRAGIFSNGGTYLYLPPPRCPVVRRRGRSPLRLSWDSWIRESDPENGFPLFLVPPPMFIEGAAEFLQRRGPGRNPLTSRAIDDKTFEINLIGPLPYVIDALGPTMPSASPPMHVIEEFGDDWIKARAFSYPTAPFVPRRVASPAAAFPLFPTKNYWGQGRRFPWTG